MDDPTLLLHWLFSCLALLIMGVRLVWRKAARQDFNLGDYLTVAACVCALTRLGLIHVVLTWGTNNVSPKLRATHTFTDEEIYRREIGSKLSVVNRVFYNSYLWLQKLVLLDVYRRLLLNLRYEKITIWSFSIVFFGTYVACQVTTFSECNPFHLYWQVVPDPGSCSKAQVQLVVVGVLNIVTDFMLLVLPIPLVVSLKTPWQRKVQLYALFTLGIFIIAITVIRLPININNKDSQVNRTTWASTELLTAAIVVNAPTLYGLWNKKRQAKSSAKSQGTSGLHYYAGGTHASTAHRSTVRGGAGEEEVFAMNSRRKMGPMEGIMQTKEVIVSEFRQDGERQNGRYENLPDDVENASSHSSQHGILKN
ncbi:Pth11-like integral membrane protein [Colletotrichum musicola]|uniref:Pth11-like integral membrane protein n=1 Tax=Colletotrichum musicola TaxID=2175873 RepID=A0A8H6NEG6_9PEZI|nr:Pth11-like integral membrane protein [Colletotrichum musicola]